MVFNPSAAPWVGDMSSPTSAVAYQAFLEQMSAFCEGDYTAAIAAGRRATRESPRVVAALFNLALAYGNTGQAEQGDSLWSVLEGLRGEMTRNEELSLDAWGAMWDGDLERAERAMDEAYRLDPVGRAGGALQVKARSWRMADAVRLLEEVDFENCPFPGFYRDGADAYHALGRFQEELELVRRARAAYPEDPGFLGDETSALVGLGREEAVDSLLRTLDGVPGPLRVRVQTVAMSEMRAHGLESAADRLAETILAALHEQPSSMEPWLQRVVALYFAGRWEESLSLLEGFEGFEDVLSRSIGNQGSYGALLGRVGRRAEASAVAEQIETGVSGSVRQQSLARAQIAAALGDGDEAVRLLELGGAPFHFLHTEPTFDEIRSYPPFLALTTPR